MQTLGRSVEGGVGEGVGAGVLGAGNGGDCEGVEAAAEVDETIEEGAKALVADAVAVLELTDDELRVHAQFDVAGAEGEGGFESRDRSPVLGLIVCRRADSL